MKALRTVCLCGLGFATLAQAQEALRNSLAAERVAEQRRRELENQPYNLRWGDLKVLASASLAGEYNDNVRHSDLLQETDFILRPMVNLNAVHPIGQANLFKASVGVGYEKYLDHGDYDRLIVTPGTELSFDVFVKDFRINIHDRFSYEMDPGRLGSISGVGKYGGFYNTAGASVLGDFKDILAMVGYDFYTFTSSEKDYEYLDRKTHNVMARGSIMVHPTTTVGLEAGASPTLYDQPLLNDNTGYNVGAYVEWRVTEHLKVQPRGGYTYYTFVENRYFGKPEDFSGYYFGVTADHQLNQNLSYSLDSGRDIQPGMYSNLLDMWRVALTFRWQAFKSGSVSFGVNYENGEEKNWRIGDQFERYGVNVGFSYRLMEKLTASAGYRFWLKDSNVAFRDYTQNRATLTLTYRF